MTYTKQYHSSVADPEICPRGARRLVKLVVPHGDHLIFTGFNRGKGAGARAWASGTPQSATAACVIKHEFNKKAAGLWHSCQQRSLHS